MPKSKSPASTVPYNCDICDFKVTNNYIFKRHLHRCYTLHGVASKRSSPRQPIRNKGTEGVRSATTDKNGELESAGLDYNAEDDLQSMNSVVPDGSGEDDSAEDIDIEDENDDNDNDNLVMEGVSQGENDNDNDGSQYGEEGYDNGVYGDEESGGGAFVDKDISVSLGDEGDSTSTMDSSLALGVSFVTDDDRSMDMMDSPTSSVVKAKFERNYLCDYCPFKTLKSREILYHLRDVHDERLNIFECTMCDYASRYNNKVARHMSVHKKAGSLDLVPIVPGSGDAIGEENTAQAMFPAHQFPQTDGAELIENQELKVKPLKLKRLHVKTPSLFKVTHESKLKKEPQDHPLAPPPATKNVFRMILSEDGSHDYECRDCLFYASTALAVKKHYQLCHSKVLQCDHCTFNTTIQAEYYEHIVTHKGRITYHKCPDCSYVTHAKPTFDNHRHHHGSPLPYKCKVCNFAADSESKVKRHLATQHTNRQEDSDPEAEPPQPTLLADHQQHFLGPPPPQQPQQLLQQSDLLGWVDGDRLECQEDMGGMTMDAASLTMKSASSSHFMESMDQTKAKQPKTTILKFKCPHCNCVCLRRANLTRHLVAKHDYDQKKASISSKTLERQMLRKRKPSGQSSSSSSSLVLASASKFLKPQTVSTPDEESLQCAECPYYAKWPSDLKRHKQVHTMVKRFRCPICTNKYKYLGDLNVHMRRDHLTEPQLHQIPVAEEVVSSEVIKKSSPVVFRCPICAYATGNKADLEQHTKQHGDIEKTFQCRLCDYQTYWRGDVGRHLFRHHNIHLNKDGADLENYFIFRNDIRPLTKMPLSHLSATPMSSQSVKLEDSFDSGDYIDMKNNAAAITTPGNKSSSSSSGKLSFKNVLMSKHVVKAEGSLTCSLPTCEYRTTTTEKLQIHMAQHENIKIFVCPMCGKRANYKWDIVKHMVKVHKNPNAARDDVITLSMQEARDTIADYLGSFERKSVENTPTFGCNSCDFQSGEKSLIMKHMEEIHHETDTGQILSFFGSSSSMSGVKVKQEGCDVTEGLKQEEEEEDNQDVLRFVEPSPEELARHEKPYACGICKADLLLPDMPRHYKYTHRCKEVRVIYTPDGTEFNYETFEIYPVKKTPAEAAQNFLELSGDAVSLTDEMSPGGKTMKPDYKYSNPKIHGYVKPFKCSVCGLRSNWKWDLKKHLRAKHAHDGGFVIMLSIEEAQMTYGKECSRSHPKCEVQGTFSNNASSTGPTLSPDITPTKTSLIFNESISLPNNPSQSSSFSRTKSASQPASLGTNFDPGRRQWKCSGCDYITNWRRNMARHMARRHAEERDQLRVISLHMLSKPDQEAILEERRTRLEKLGKFVVDLDEEEEESGGGHYENQIDDLFDDVQQELKHSKLPYFPPNYSKRSLSSPEGRLWKCPKCSYHSTLRTHIIIHMQKHELRPFLCGVCGVPFMNRSPLHSHIQKIHRRPDYIKLVKVNIRYDGVVDKSHLGAAVMQQVFQCVLCKGKFPEKSVIVNHLTAAHGVEDDDKKDDYITIFDTPPHVMTDGSNKNSGGASYSSITSSKLFAVNLGGKTSRSNNSNSNSNNHHNLNEGHHTIRRKLHHCRLCPYHTQKKSMLSFHMTYHKPTPANRFRCKFCPYFVSTTRLLHQHQRKWHMDPSKKGGGGDSGGAIIHSSSSNQAAMLNAALWEHQQLIQTTPPHSPYKARGAGGSGSPRKQKYNCVKCPYTTNSKNDFYYHKQFHRPKRTAEYKCDLCDYWVTQKRLLKQHMRLHEQDALISPDVSPVKSVYSDPGLVYDPVELTELAALKQNIISAKVLPSLSKSPKISPMKIASRCAVDDKPGYVLKNGLYRRLHKCPHCPYTNIRTRNMSLHVMMHGPRESSYPLIKCPYCDYYVGSKGLLSHHMKVHQRRYGDTPENDALKASQGIPVEDFEDGEDSDDLMDIQQEQKVDTLLQISRMKRFGCEKCPYASAKRQHFERHLELHGSRQRYTCQYCDYSVPSSYLLTQHSRLHLMPNQNLLLAQSVNSLQHLTEVPADVALASALPPSDSDMAVTISVVHDHLGLYENSIYDPQEKKLYRCDRCPYANVRRDHLLSHLKFHMVSSSLVCPYCDYSAPKQPLLTQHIRVHFCPLPELSDWLMENGQMDREASQRNIDMAEALKVAREYQSQSKKKSKERKEEDGEKEKKENGGDGGGVKKGVEEKENIETKTSNGLDPYICQYCDREFGTSDKLVKHELQHLIGNQFQMAMVVLKEDGPIMEQKTTMDVSKSKHRESTRGQNGRKGNDDSDRMKSEEQVETEASKKPSEVVAGQDKDKDKEAVETMEVEFSSKVEDGGKDDSSEDGVKSEGNETVVDREKEGMGSGDGNDEAESEKGGCDNDVKEEKEGMGGRSDNVSNEDKDKEGKEGEDDGGDDVKVNAAEMFMEKERECSKERDDDTNNKDVDREIDEGGKEESGNGVDGEKEEGKEEESGNDVDREKEEEGKEESCNSLGGEKGKEGEGIEINEKLDVVSQVGKVVVDLKEMDDDDVVVDVVMRDVYQSNSGGGCENVEVEDSDLDMNMISGNNEIKEQSKEEIEKDEEKEEACVKDLNEAKGENNEVMKEDEKMETDESVDDGEQERNVGGEGGIDGGVSISSKQGEEGNGAGGDKNRDGGSGGNNDIGDGGVCSKKDVCGSDGGKDVCGNGSAQGTDGDGDVLEATSNSSIKEADADVTMDEKEIEELLKDDDDDMKKNDKKDDDSANGLNNADDDDDLLNSVYDTLDG